MREFQQRSNADLTITAVALSTGSCAISPRMTTDIVVDAFRMGVFRQKGVPALVHSDRGSQYASQDFRDELKKYDCRQSMSRKGNCWDNAVAESLIHLPPKRFGSNYTDAALRAITAKPLRERVIALCSNP